MKEWGFERGMSMLRSTTKWSTKNEHDRMAFSHVDVRTVRTRAPTPTTLTNLSVQRSLKHSRNHMAQASRRLRKIRRIKRDRTLAYRLLDKTTIQRDTWMQIAQSFAQQLEAKDKPTVPLEGEIVPELTIEVIPEPILDGGE